MAFLQMTEGWKDHKKQKGRENFLETQVFNKNNKKRTEFEGGFENISDWMKQCDFKAMWFYSTKCTEIQWNWDDFTTPEFLNAANSQKIWVVHPEGC